MHRSAPGWRLIRQRECRDDTAGRFQGEREFRGRAELRREPRPDVGEARSAAAGFHETLTGVGDLDAQPAAFRRGAHVDAAALGQRAKAVLDRVLDQREQHQRRHPGCPAAGRDIDREGQPAAHADLLDVEVRRHMIDFAAERGFGRAHLRQRDGKIMLQVLHHSRAAGAVGFVEPLDMRKRVEQEMRLDLRLHLQARLHHLAFECGAVRFRLLHRPEAHDLVAIELADDGQHAAEDGIPWPGIKQVRLDAFPGGADLEILRQRDAQRRPMPVEMTSVAASAATRLAPRWGPRFAVAMMPTSIGTAMTSSVP